MINGVKSAELKLKRAKTHLRTIERCSDLYSAGRPHKIVPKSDGKKKLNIPKPPPQAISLLAGEMIYQMRSALDHLAFELVQWNATGIELPKDWRKRCDFPLYTTIPIDPDSHAPYSLPVPYKAFRRVLPGISAEAHKFVESIQPYHGKTLVQLYLGYLAHLSNIDKHRHLNLIRTRIRTHEDIRVAGRTVRKRWKLWNRGETIDLPTDIGGANQPLTVRRTYHSFIAFDERNSLENATDMPLQVLLKLTLYHVEIFVVPPMKNLIGSLQSLNGKHPIEG